MPIKQSPTYPLSQKLSTLHGKLMSNLKNLPEPLIHKKTITDFIKNENISISDVLSYLIGWGNMLLSWYEQGLSGKDFVMPGQGFEKWDYAKIAQHFFKKYNQNTLVQQLVLLEQTTQEIVSLIEKESTSGNIDKLGIWKWCTLKSGKQWPLSKWITVNSIAPYTRAITKIRRVHKIKMSTTHVKSVPHPDGIKLGLPLEYQEMPEFFDAHNVTTDTDLKNSRIEKILKKHNVKTVLDLTCGTGSQVFFLAKRGYQVTGADFSPPLLDKAREKATKDKINVQFIDGDMRTLNVGLFDAVITIFNAIGHLTKSDFVKTIQNIHKNLHPGGLYLFDIFNLSAMTEKVVESLAMQTHKTVGNKHLQHIQHSKVDTANGLLTSQDSYTLSQGGKETKKFNNQFSLQIYTPKELRNILAEHGFQTIEQQDFDGSRFSEDSTLSILTIAKKI
ncbi:MAG: ClbS/DfsB family four-helix bundle protein [Epsilonproteobacteria bacterium]|nr:ClbS/DfsB family four-helix bundle protein [Campylobacterota bacterium]